MSNLIAPPNIPQPQARNPELLAKAQVQQIKASPRRILETMVESWTRSFDMLWNEREGVTAAHRLAALGTDAVALFVHSKAMVEFLLATIGDKDPALTAKIASRLAAMPATTVHDDGTVTID